MSALELASSSTITLGPATASPSKVRALSEPPVACSPKRNDPLLSKLRVLSPVITRSRVINSSRCECETSGRSTTRLAASEARVQRAVRHTHAVARNTCASFREKCFLSILGRIQLLPDDHRRSLVGHASVQTFETPESKGSTFL